MEGTPHGLALFLSGPMSSSPGLLSSCELKLGTDCSHQVAQALHISAILTLPIWASTESRTLMLLGVCFPKSKFMLSQTRKRPMPVPGRCQLGLLWLWHGHSPRIGLCSTDGDWTALWEFHTSHQRVRWPPSCDGVISGSRGIFFCKLHKLKHWQTRMTPACGWPLDVPCVVIPAVRTQQANPGFRGSWALCEGVTIGTPCENSSPSPTLNRRPAQGLSFPSHKLPYS